MTAPFPFAYAMDEHPTDAARIVGQALAEQQARPAPLGLVYLSADYVEAAGAILETLKAATGVQAWTGAVGMGVIAGGHECFGRPALAAMLLDLPDGAAQPFGPITSAVGLRAVGGQAKAFSGALGTALGILHVDPMGDPTGAGVAGLPAALAEAGGLYLVGGLCSGQDQMPAISSGGPALGGATGAVVSLESGVATGVSQGCAPIGPVRTMTTADVGIIAALGVAVITQWRSRAPGYGLTVIWALFAIIMANGIAPLGVSLLAGAGIAVMTVLTITTTGRPIS